MSYFLKYKSVILAFICVTSVLYTWMWGIQSHFPVISKPESTDTLYKGVALEMNPWLESWQRWDTPHYQAIAERGYRAFDTALFTPPLYPLLMAIISSILGINTLVSGLFISGVFTLATVIVFHTVSNDILGNEKDSMHSTLYLLVFPTSFFLIAAYAESMFLFCAVLSLFLAYNENWILAGIFGGAAALTRSPGILIIIPLFYAVYKNWKANKEFKPWLSVIIVLALAALFPIFAWLTVRATPLNIISAISRGGYLTFPGLNLLMAIQQIIHHQLIIENIIELSFTLLFIILAVAVWVKLPRIYGVYTITMLLFFLCRMGEPQPLVSMSRYVIEIFPAFILLAIWAQKPYKHRIIFYLSCLGLLFMSGQFALWGWVG